MAVDSGIELDFLTDLVNVQWTGLAVEFGKMAEDAPGKATMSRRGMVELFANASRADPRHAKGDHLTLV